MSAGRILLADDEPTFLHSTADLLRREGFECECVQDGEAAAGALRSQVFDLLIADIRMPGNPELELIEEVPRMAPGLPVILVTGYPSLKTAVHAIKLPVVGYLVKPLEFDELLSLVKSALQQCRSYRVAASLAERLRQWQQQIQEMANCMAERTASQRSVTLEAFIALTMRNIIGSLEDLHHLTQAVLANASSDHPCQLLNCPRQEALTKAVRETIEVLEKTRRSFKSKELGELRKKLEALL